MNEWFAFLAPLLLRAAIVMLLVMLAVRCLLWLLTIQSPAWHRWVSGVVLLQGWLIAPLVIAIPWYEPPVVVKQPEPALAAVAAPDSATEFAAFEVTAPNDLNEAALPAPAGFQWSQLLPASFAPLIGAWVFGMAALVTVALRNYGQHCRLAIQHQPLDATTAQEWQTQLQRVKAPLNLPLRLTNSTGPMLCLLPRGYEIWVPAEFWRACSPAEQEAILRHELSHYRRGDVWKTWLIYLLALPQWFNPAAWWAVWNFQQAGEWLCDLDVARAAGERADYLQALLRLVELQPPKTSVAGHCAHAHPLLVRVRRLVSSSPRDSAMKQTIFAAALCAVVGVALVRVQFVARAADPPASVLAVKDKIVDLENRLTKVKDDLAALKERGETLKSKIEDKVDSLNKLAEDPTQLSDELKAKAKTFMGGDEAAQLAVVKDFAKLPSENEQVLALGRAVKDSSHAAVRQQGLTSIAAKGEAFYPAIAISFESLDSKDRAFLAKELAKQASDDKLILYGLMAKNADDELTTTLLGLDLPAKQRLTMIGMMAEGKKDDEKFVNRIVEIGDKTAGDDGLVILFAAAGSQSTKAAAAAVKSAVKRKKEAWPVIAVAYKTKDKEVRTAVVRAAKELGGEEGDFLIKTALADEDAELKAAAEAAVK